MGSVMNLVNSRSLYEIIQRLTIQGKDKFIEEEEARYDRQIDALASEIVENHVKMVLLAGPSGSGKDRQQRIIYADLVSCRR